MSKRYFFQCSILASLVLMVNGLVMPSAIAQTQPIKIIMSGYSPDSTSFSRALKRIGDRVEAKFPGQVEFHYVYNILDLGYKGLDILWLVENGVVSMGYQSSSYLTDRVGDLGAVDLPFIFSDTESARKSMDGDLGQLLTQRIEAETNYRILGYFENGERHISNKVRPISTPLDMQGLLIRTLPSKVHERTFELLGAQPEIMDLSEVIKRVVAGTIDAQENPFANTVTYGVHNFHKYHTATRHFYISRPIFFHRPTFDAWPPELQAEMRAAVNDAIVFQRQLKDQEELDAQTAIRQAGGEIIELTPEQRQLFIEAVSPIYAELRDLYSPEIQQLLGL